MERAARGPCSSAPTESAQARIAKVPGWSDDPICQLCRKEVGTLAHRIVCPHDGEHMFRERTDGAVVAQLAQGLQRIHAIGIAAGIDKIILSKMAETLVVGFQRVQ